MSDIFDSLSEESMASASMGQVDKGILKSNGMVVGGGKGSTTQGYERMSPWIYICHAKYFGTLVWKKFSAKPKEEKKERQKESIWHERVILIIIVPIPT